MPEWPVELKLEVKTSRSGTFPIGDRDIEGVGPRGYVAALLNDRLLHGPRWVLVPAREMRARVYSERELSDGHEASDLAESINRGWSDWILDGAAWGLLLEPGIQGVAERIDWCRREHPPRAHQSRGNIREVKLEAALRELRARLDQVASGESGSQVEGQFHQALLGDVLRQMGYGATLNPVGVPDIVAKRPGSAPGSDVRAGLEDWRPDSEQLRAARDVLLALPPGELSQLIERLRGRTG